MATTKTKAVELTAQRKTKNSDVSGSHVPMKKTPAKKPAVKKVGRSGQTAGVAKPAVKKVGRSGSVSGAAKPAAFNNAATIAAITEIATAPVKKVAAKKPVAAKRPKPASPSATPALNSSTQSAVSSAPSSAKEERRVNHDSPISDTDAMRNIMNGIVEANTCVHVTDNARFLDHVVMLVMNSIGGRIFGASTYERLIRSALNTAQIKARKPLFTGLPDAIERLKLLVGENSNGYVKQQNSSLSGEHMSASASPFKKATDATLKTAPEGGKPDAITAAIKNAVGALNGSGDLTRKDIARVVHREAQGKTVNVTTSVDGIKLAQVLSDAFVRADETIQQFRIQERSSLRPFVTFFERFWGVIEHRVDMTLDYTEATFRRFMTENLPNILTHGEFARYTFTCGSRAIVHHSLAGSAVMVIAPNEFVSQLKRMPFADKQTVNEQAAKNPPTFTFFSSIPMGLSALVRCDFDQPGLSLLVLNRVFGDPIEYALHLGDSCLATNVEALLDHLVDCEARVPRKAA